MAGDFDVEAMFMAAEEPQPSATTTEPGATNETPTTETEDETTAEEAAVDAASEETEEAAPEAEAEETPAEETEQPDAEVLKALKPKAIKRFNQMLSQRDEALAEARQAKAEAAALKAQIDQRLDEPKSIIKSGDPLAKVTNEEQLDAWEELYTARKEWCQLNPNGGVPPKELNNGHEIELSAEEVGQSLVTSERILRAVPSRRELLQKFRAERAKVREAAPEMFTAGTPEYKAAMEYQRKLLSFDTQADQDAIIRKLIAADKREAEEAAGVRYTRVETKKAATTAAQPGAKPAPKPAPAAARTPVVRPAGAKTGPAAAWEKLNAPRGEVDVEELMEA